MAGKLNLRALGASAVVIGLLLVAVGCGGDDDSPDDPTPAGKTLTTETLSGLKLSIEPFVSPDSDPELAKYEELRVEAGAADVDYHRMTADNTEGFQPEFAPEVTFAKDAESTQTGDSISTQYLCDVAGFEWLAIAGKQRVDSTLCEDAPPNTKVKPGESVTYYLLTPLGFGTGDIEDYSVFGPVAAPFE